MEKKKCTHCKKKKLLSLFSKNKSKKDSLADECKECSALRTKLWREKNPEQAYNARKAWYANNKQKHIGYVNKYNQTRDDGLYYKYWTIKRRCEYPSQEKYKYYGGKGIVVEWKTYQEFKDDMYKSYKRHLKKYGHRQTTIDRIDPDKNYCKENCRWATYKVQASKKGRKTLSTG